MMDNFIDDIIEYIKTELNNNPAFKNEVTVNRAYSKANTIKSPQVSVFALSDDDYRKASTFMEEKACQYPIQFYCYWKDGIKYKNMPVNSQIGSEILGGEVSKLFDDKQKAMAFNKNILLIQKIGGRIGGMPTLDGSTNYQTIQRYIFTITKPYQSNN